MLKVVCMAQRAQASHMHLGARVSRVSSIPLSWPCGNEKIIKPARTPAATPTTHEISTYIMRASCIWVVVTALATPVANALVLTSPMHARASPLGLGRQQLVVPVAHGRSLTPPPQMSVTASQVASTQWAVC